MKKVSTKFGFILMIIMSFSIGCKKHKMKKINYLQMKLTNENETIDLENLNMSVIHYKSSDTYSFSCLGNKEKIDQLEYSYNLLVEISNFKIGDKKTFSISDNSPNFRIDLGGMDPANSYGTYTTTNQIGGKKGYGTVVIQKIDLDKKIIRGYIENAKSWGQGWAFGVEISIERIDFNIVDFEIVEYE